MTIYTCNCQKNFKSKYLAKRHLEYSHKEEILELEVRLMYNSKNCLYCFKKIDGSTELHLRPHIKKIITKFFDSWMSKSSSVLPN